MSSLLFKFPDIAISLAVAAAILAHGARAEGQACCAGSGVVTPGRLALHESALLGVQAKMGSVLGSFDPEGRYAASPRHASELDLEQDVFAALRLVERGQLALLIPFVVTRRETSGQSELGGGIGDVNISLRYDLTLAGASLSIPGVAALGGVTVPTGKPPDAADVGAQATGATGIGAYQFNLGIAVEQTFGPWLVSATGIVAQRTARTAGAGATAVHQRLAPQWSILAALAYTWSSDIAVALSASYLTEGNATINGGEAPGTGLRLATVTLAGVLPLSDAWRLQGALFANPPISHFGQNLLVDAGMSLTVIRSWI
jgi:hypothetical protein